MNINKLRNRYYNYHRKQRRNRYLTAYKELKNEIQKESKRGKLYVRFQGRFNYEYAVAARLFFRKNKDFYVRVELEEMDWGGEFKVTKILINWDINTAPEYNETITSNIDSDEEG